MPPQQQPQAPIEPEAHASKKVLYLWIAAAIVIFLVGVLAVSLRFTGANADYICTKVVSSDGVCANGSWGDWEQVSQSTEGSVTKTVEARTYTGTRSTSKTLTYLSGRATCTAGYSQGLNGYWGAGWSGFHGGSVATTYSACQLEQTRTVTKTSLSGGSSISVKSDFTQTDTEGQQTTQTQSIGSVAELETHAAPGGGGAPQSLETNVDIYAQPSLVRSGDPTTVVWEASGVESCTVAGSNGDSWSGLTGSKLSKPIVAETTFTLVCAVSDGDPLTGTAKVNVEPTFQEL